MKRNTEFSYLYRDGNNYKKSGSVVFAGTVPPEVIGEMVKSFEEEQFFVPGQIGIPPVFLYSPFGEYGRGESDHNFHEFDGVTTVDGTVPATDPKGRTMAEFVEQVLAASENGWRSDVLPTAWADDGTPVINENCLYGVSCPNCLSQGPFLTRVAMTMEVSDDGTEFPRNHGTDTAAEWDGVFLSRDEVDELADLMVKGVAVDDRGRALEKFLTLIKGRNRFKCLCCGYDADTADFYRNHPDKQ